MNENINFEEIYGAPAVGLEEFSDKMDAQTLESLKQQGLDIGIPSSLSMEDSVSKLVGNSIDDDLAKAEAEAVVEEATIDTNVEEPNLILPRSELIRALRFANIMVKRITSDIEASSLNITYKDGKVLYRLTDRISFVCYEGSCEVSNNNPITETLSIKVGYLQRLVVLSASNKILFYKGKLVDKKQEENDVIYIRLSNGDLLVDARFGDESKLVPEGNKTEKMNSINSNIILSMCKSLIPPVSTTNEVSSKRAVILNDRAFFKEAGSTVRFDYNFNFKICLTKKELDLLYLVSSVWKDEDITFYKTDLNDMNRIVISVPGLEISSNVSIPEVDARIQVMFDLISQAKYMGIDKVQFKRDLILSGLGENKTGKVIFNYNSDGKGIDMNIEGKNGDCKLLIEGNVPSDAEQLKEIRKTDTTKLLGLLRSFEMGGNTQIAIMPDGFCVKDESINLSAYLEYCIR